LNIQNNKKSSIKVSDSAMSGRDGKAFLSTKGGQINDIKVKLNKSNSFIA
jgi:hypothetical protein